MIGVVGIYQGSDLATEVAVMMLILNALNLLPLLPLDGGWAAHGLFFSRHYGVDVVFRVIAALAVLGISIVIGDMFLIGLGVVLLIGLPTVLRSGRIVHRLKSEHLAASQDDQTIPSSTAARIIDEIDQEFPPAGLNNKLKAQFTLDIFQSLNTKPPGLFGTLALSFVHAGSFLAAFVTLVVLAIGQQAQWGDLFNIAMDAPESVYECGTTVVATGATAEATMNAAELCIIAAFQGDEECYAAFEQSSQEIPESAILRVFGQTLLMALPPDYALRDQWVGQFERQGATVNVRKEGEQVSVSLVFISPTEADAERIDDELNLYFQCVQTLTSAFPPWRPEVLTEQHLKARRTLRKLNRADQAYEEIVQAAAKESQEELQPLYRKLQKANQRGNKAITRVAQDEIADLTAATERKRVEAIQDLGPDVVDVALVDVFLERPV